MRREQTRTGADRFFVPAEAGLPPHPPAATTTAENGGSVADRPQRGIRCFPHSLFFFGAVSLRDLLAWAGLAIATLATLWPLGLTNRVLAGVDAFTYFTRGRFTNMSALFFITSLILFMLGLVSEQITQLRYDRVESGG